ncbi:MAG: hypothetical protein ISS61_13850 [Desulfobacteraceae bacterium]|nr:hypothetical protein [Desulfobacteraceae bacterium]
MVSNKFVVKVSVTGSIGDRTGNPAIPITPGEIRESTLGVYETGPSGVRMAEP